MPIAVTCHHATICVTFYPVTHDQPILSHDGWETYIVPAHTIPGHWIDDSDSSSSNTTMENAFVVNTTFATTLAVRKKGPPIAEIVVPCDLANYIPASGATQHMTPRHADLFNVVEEQNLGVKVADGHVIKCSTAHGRQQRQSTSSDP